MVVEIRQRRLVGVSLTSQRRVGAATNKSRNGRNSCEIHHRQKSKKKQSASRDFCRLYETSKKYEVMVTISGENPKQKKKKS